METVEDVLRKMRSMKSTTLHGKMWVNTIHSLADRLEAAIKREREAVGGFINEVVWDCDSVRVNCCNCDKSEDFYFVPKGSITKLESAIAQGEAK
jgi:hypothetical protein